MDPHEVGRLGRGDEMTLFNSIIAVLLLAGAVFFMRALCHVRRRRLGRASSNGLGSGICFLLGGLGLSLAFNLYAYQRLTYEQPVATLTCRQAGGESSSDVFRVHLARAQAPDRTFRVVGQSWQLSARVLKWRAWANLIGLDARYQFNRLSGRYESAQQAIRKRHTVYELNDRGGGLSAWATVHWLNTWLPLIDTRYGSAVYMPMANGARYKVALTQSGLVARAANAEARQAVRGWTG